LQTIGQSIPTTTAKQAFCRSRVHPQIAFWFHVSPEI
jgi:hypothetical protein